MPQRLFTYDQIQQHRSTNSCWVALYGNVYDVTSFLKEHPGGSRVILQLAGTDATKQYDPIHPPGTLEASLPATAKLGAFDESTAPQKPESRASQTPRHDDATPDLLESLEDCLSLDDIEALATKKLTKQAWAYYYSAGDDLISKRLNNIVYSSVLLRPRIFVDCTRCDTSATLLGHNVQVPFFVAPAAMARLAHPDGEHGIARACADFGALQIISNNASQTPEQIVANAPPHQIFGWQMYVQTDRSKTEKMLDRIHKLPAIKFICLTLDAPVPGKREHDERSKSVGAHLPVPSSVKSDPSSGGSGKSDNINGGGSVGKTLFAGTAADLTWTTTLPWLRARTTLPLVLKGIQTHEDAFLASLHTPQIAAIILSNHGGRAADTAPPPLHTLLEIRQHAPSVFARLEVWLDGGIRRGTDVVKALALGARAVGLGRAPLFGLGAGGQHGVHRVLEIMRAEIETAMRLLGCERVEQLNARCVNARAVEREIYNGPAGLDDLAAQVAKAKL